VKYHELRPKKEARPQRRRLGRGMGSGRGKTAGRGTKGQLARSGGGKPAPFIGGAFPLTRTMPHKKGFRSPFRVEFALVKVGALDERFADGATVTRETLQVAGLVKERQKPIKLLSDGEVTKRLVVRVDRASAQARRKIEAAGGTVEETLPRKTAGAPAGGKEA
jgi:large subunit ribosomal protein L15